MTSLLVVKIVRFSFYENVILSSKTLLYGLRYELEIFRDDRYMIF